MENGGNQWQMLSAILQADVPPRSPQCPSSSVLSLTPADSLCPWPDGPYLVATMPSPVCPSPRLLCLSPQIAAMRAASPTRSATRGAGPTRRAATCWSVCAWATARANGPASLWVSGSFPLSAVRACGPFLLVFPEVSLCGNAPGGL